MKITVELNEKEKGELRERAKDIMAIVGKIAESELWIESQNKGYRIPGLRGALNELFRAKDKIECLTELDVVDNNA